MIILASASPARAHLLRLTGLEFVVKPTHFDEDSFKTQTSDPQTLVMNLAEAKAKSLHHAPATIIAADTIVVSQEEIIGKPKDRADANRIISRLAGHTHDVWTGVCVTTPRTAPHHFAEKSTVTLRAMSDQEMQSYLDTNEWQGKAGGYQIGKTIAKYVTRIDGSYTNIIGLPLSRLIQVGFQS